MKIYISSHNVIEAQELASKLKTAGHEITSLWHAVNFPEVPSTEGVIWKQRTVRNFHCIRDSDCLILIGGSDRFPGGKYVEAGYAHGCGIPVFNLGPVGNGMMNFAKVCKDIDALLAIL